MADIPENNLSQQLTANQSRFLEKPQVKIVKSSSRRKFLVSLLGSTAILGLGAPPLVSLLQNMWVALGSKGFPYDRDWWVSSYSFDLNFVALVNEKNGNLRVWDYQQQSMTLLIDGASGVNLSAWSPDNRYLLCQAMATDSSGDVVSNTLEMWDVQARRKIRSLPGADYVFNDDSNFENFDKIRWSPDGSRIALFLKDSLAILDAGQLIPLFTLPVPAATSVFAWSPDARRLALLVGQDEAGSWSIQIWNLQTRHMEMQVPFKGEESNRRNVLVWAPTSEYIAALAHQQLQIIHAQSASNYRLDVPNDGGFLAWSPDGQHLAVAAASNYGPDIFLGPLNDEVSVWDVVVKRQVRVLNNDAGTGLQLKAISWSKDGKRITAIAQLYQQTSWDWL